jgi:hypothetical protein
MNPIEMIKNMVINRNINNPVLKEVITKAQKGDSKGVEDFARNFLKEQGRDFDKEFGEFMKNFK